MEKNNKKNVFIIMNLHHLNRIIFALKKHKYAQITRFFLIFFLDITIGCIDLSFFKIL